jgi:hypothetical protein
LLPSYQRCFSLKSLTKPFKELHLKVAQLLQWCFFLFERKPWKIYNIFDDIVCCKNEILSPTFFMPPGVNVARLGWILPFSRKTNFILFFFQLLKLEQLLFRRRAGLPDGIFSNQKSQFWVSFGVSCSERRW